MAHHQPVTVGIDLGTTYSCAAVFRNGRPEVIANEYGDYVTPSCVAFEEGQCIVGKEARENSFTRPTNTIFSTKRIFGCKFDDPKVQLYKTKWPFGIVSVDGIPHIEVTDTENINGQSSRLTKRYKPEDISSFVLTKMKTIVDDFLTRGPDDPPLHAVITVPSSFNDSQRRATVAAGEKAGLKVLAVVNEPTAAAVAYGLNKINETQTILVFDLGGGTLDVSILRVTSGRKFELLSTAGNSNMGGEDFDERVFEYCIAEFEAKYSVRVNRASKGVACLRLKVEDMKKSFTSQNSKVMVSVDAFHEARHLTSTISKVKFDELCTDLFQKTLEPVQDAIQRANLQKTDITHIVLVGGCSRVLKIRDILKAFFANQSINKDINADQAIACGAAVVAHQLVNENSPVIEECVRIQLSDAIFPSLHTGTLGGVVAPVIPRKIEIPANEASFPTTERNGEQPANNIAMAQSKSTLYVDFGTAYVKCAVKLPDGSFKLLPVKGHPSVPAYLWCDLSTEVGDFSIGHDAKELSITGTHNVWFYPLLFLRQNVPSWIEKLRLPFTVEYGRTTNACQVNFGRYNASVVELLGVFLKELRQICRNEIGFECALTDCVIAAQSISVIQSELYMSASSSGFQRVSLVERQLSQLTGLLHYFPEWRNAAKHIVIIRIGACFTTLSIHAPEHNQEKYGLVEFFGGNDIDELLSDYCLRRFEKLYGLDLNSPPPVYSKESLHRLRLNCEAVKIQLSTDRSFTLEVRQFHEGLDLVVDLTVDKLKDIIGKACYLILRNISDSALGYLALPRNQVQYEVILMGGTSKIPLLQDLVGCMLKKPNQRVQNIMDAVLLSGMGLLPVEKYEAHGVERMSSSSRMSLATGVPRSDRVVFTRF